MLTCVFVLVCLKRVRLQLQDTQVSIGTYTTQDDAAKASAGEEE